MPLGRQAGWHASVGGAYGRPQPSVLLPPPPRRPPGPGQRTGSSRLRLWAGAPWAPWAAQGRSGRGQGPGRVQGEERRPQRAPHPRAAPRRPRRGPRSRGLRRRRRAHRRARRRGHDRRGRSAEGHEARGVRAAGPGPSRPPPAAARRRPRRRGRRGRRGTRTAAGRGAGLPQRLSSPSPQPPFQPWPSRVSASPGQHPRPCASPSRRNAAARRRRARESARETGTRSQHALHARGYAPWMRRWPWRHRRD